MPSHPSLFSRQVLTTVCGLILALSFGRAATTHDFPPIKLRGYGTLFGHVTTSSANGQSTSVLKITCDDEAKAKLVLAKYLSDLQLLPEVQTITVQGREGAISAYSIDTTGSILAARDDDTVYVLAANSADALAKLESGDFAPKHGPLVFKPQTDVPMYLNRFDKFGWRFYCPGLRTPEGDRGYDVTQEYDYLKQIGDTDFLIWGDTDRVNTAEGMTNDIFWKWSAELARNKGFPVGINTNSGYEASAWLLNRYRDQAAFEMPGYVGGYYDTGGYNVGAMGWMSWASTTGEDALLSLTQDTVRHMSKLPNVTSYLEPHAETEHSAPDVLLEYGPVADTSYRGYLRKKYETLKALNAAWQTDFTEWSDVRVPELASFLNYGPKAIDLTGPWRYGADDPKSPPTDSIFDEKFDDSKWPTMIAPGHDNQAVMIRTPAMFRRSFDVPSGWSAKNPKSWLYVWDLNRGNRLTEMKVSLNGKILATSHMTDPPHIAIFEVKDILRDGSNVVAIHTPQGRLSYKVYVSPDEPLKYPNLGDGKNMQWVDFVDWDLWIRGDSIRRGMEAIRQVDPDRGIMLMSPDSYAEQIKDDAKKYGGDFHNTGYMAAWNCDRLPAWMRGAGLPISVEPGNGAPDVQQFALFTGSWFSEGVNAVDYFGSLGEVLWRPAIKQYFEDHLKLYKMFGKYHAPFADIAALYSSRVQKIVGFPWSADGFTADPDSYKGGAFVSQYNPRGFMPNYESDAVTESSFAGGDASKYRFVIDSNTWVMDDSTVSAIEKYVKEGGVFVTFGETGRHSPGKKDAWPIERLTGYHATSISHPSSEIVPADGQQVLPPDWAVHPEMEGVVFQKAAPECVDLLHWPAGGTAVGMRALGKGYVITLGGRMPPPIQIKFFAALFQWQNLPAIPAHVEAISKSFNFRHYISNNGLYDVWTFWNFDRNNIKTVKADIVFDKIDPKWAVRIKDGVKLPIDNHRLSITTDPFETAIYITPRSDITAASTEWLTLQRGWWQGTETPQSIPLPAPEHKWSVNLDHDWAIKPVTDTDKVDAMTAAKVNDAKWDHISLGIWNTTPGYENVTHAVMRKKITVPEDWTNGDPTLWIRAWDGDTFCGAAQLYIDGIAVFPKPSSHGPEGINPGDVLKPGTTHTIALDIDGGPNAHLVGTHGNAWLWFWPNPSSSVDLTGKWEGSPDGLTFNTQVAVPGAFTEKIIRTNLTVPDDKKHLRSVIDLTTEGGMHTVIINGHLVARHHHNIGDRWQLDITPWIHFGASNELELYAEGNKTVRKASLDFFKPGVYP